MHYLLSNVYSSQAQVLCDVIKNWQEKEPHHGFAINWLSISALLQKRGVVLPSTSCHVLWKYLAYGMVIEKHTLKDKEATLNDEVDIESDEVI